MTQRETTLATGLVVLVGAMAGLGLLYVFAWKPYTDSTDRLAAAQTALDAEEGKLTKEQVQNGAILKVDPKLNLWEEISLPPRDPSLKATQTMTEEMRKRHVQHLQVDYEKYVHDMMRNNRFKAETIAVQMAPVERQQVKKGQQPTYERVAFRVSGRGDLKCVTGFMEEFHKAPLLHQIRNASVDLASARGGAKTASEGDLELKMTVEALLVTGAKDRVSLLPSKLSKPLLVLAEPARDYKLMDKKNMFTGVKPPPVKPKDDKPKDVVKPPPPPPPEKKTPKEDKADVLRFIRLTMVDYNPMRSRWEATVYDQAKGGSERKLNTRVESEYKVYDRYDNMTLDARVVHVDERQVVFKSGKSYFRLRLGEFMYPAIETAMTSAELKELGIAP